MNISGANGAGVFAVATVNVGIGGMIAASADTGDASLPIAITICETDPSTGICLDGVFPPSTDAVTTSMGAGETPTFGIFLEGSGVIPFDPAVNRIFVRFVDTADGEVRGATSVAVRTQ